jgi:hypothetical protein
VLKIREMYKSPPSSEHYLACFLTGVCVATTASTLLAVAGNADYALLIAPAILAISLLLARRMRGKGTHLKSEEVATCAAVNLMVLIVLIILSG